MSETLEPSNFDGLLDWPKLNAWIEANDLPGEGPVTSAERLTGGSQNNIFLMTRGPGQFVLRRPPKHLRANSNQTMLREARVLQALKGSDVPHPAFYAVCEDTSVIGATFYAMAPLEGFTPSRALPGGYGSDPSWRHAMGGEFMRAAAALASIDIKAAGLEDFGKPDNWHARQVARWRSQLDGYLEMPGYDGHTLPHLDELQRWLSDNVPTDGRIGLTHGDFQFANVMFSYKAPKITGVIDWEMTTVGDPMLDLGWVLGAWWEEGDPRDPLVTPWDSFVSRAELVKMYGDLTGRDMGNVLWYAGLACWKLGCVLEGSYARAKGGLIPMELGESLHGHAVGLFLKAKMLIDRGGI